MYNLLKLIINFFAFSQWIFNSSRSQAGDFTYNQITAITHDLIGKMTEGIFTSNMVLNRFRQKQEVETGGKRILAPLMTADDTQTTGSFYNSRDSLSLEEYDGISASQHDWKRIYESIVIYKTDIADNAGDAGVLKLVDQKTRQGMKAMKQRMLKGILSDGTAATGALSTKQFIGLDKVIAASGSYGGISPTDLATWVAVVNDNGGTLRSLTQAIVDGNFDATIEEGVGGATMGLMNRFVFTKFKGLFTGIQRTTRESTLDGLGHKGTTLVYNGIDYLVENQMPANTLFHVDEKCFKLHVHKDHNMRRQSINDLETADALLERIFLYGNTVAAERKFHGRVNDITV